VGHFKMYVREIGCEDVDWNHLAQDGSSGKSCEHSYEPSSFAIGRGFLDQLSEYWLLKNDSAP